MSNILVILEAGSPFLSRRARVKSSTSQRCLWEFGGAETGDDVIGADLPVDGTVVGVAPLGAAVPPPHALSTTAARQSATKANFDLVLRTGMRTSSPRSLVATRSGKGVETGQIGPRIPLGTGNRKRYRNTLQVSGRAHQIVLGCGRFPSAGPQEGTAPERGRRLPPTTGFAFGPPWRRRKHRTRVQHSRFRSPERRAVPRARRRVPGNGIADVSGSVKPAAASLNGVVEATLPPAQ